jgi:hypothetical protein
MEQGEQSGHDEPDAQQDHSQILCQPEPTHFVILLFFVSHMEYWPEKQDISCLTGSPD